MSMSKRFQIPSDEQDQKLFREAAHRAGLPAAEWARRILRAQARKELKGATFQEWFSELQKIGETPEWELPVREPAREIEDWTK